MKQNAESAPGLAEGALVVAAEARPEIDIDSTLEILAEIVDRARPIVDEATTPTARIDALNRVFFEIENFRGNQAQYDDPRNSFLDEVLARRKGLPITLSIVYVEVARRLGFEAYGVGFPGHFLAKIVGVADAPEQEIIVDVFFGRTLSLEDCAERLKAAAGGDVPFDAQWLRPASEHEIYIRMLNNMKMLYLRQGDGLGALGCFDRILTLAPYAAFEYRDRGLLLEQMDCIHAAIEDLTQYLELVPQHDGAAAIRARRDALAQRRPALN
ncbi:MAG: SirB1 family protein [Myxococcota bacterium]